MFGSGEVVAHRTTDASEVPVSVAAIINKLRGLRLSEIAVICLGGTTGHQALARSLADFGIPTSTEMGNKEEVVVTVPRVIRGHERKAVIVCAPAGGAATDKRFPPEDPAAGGRSNGPEGRCRASFQTRRTDPSRQTVLPSWHPPFGLSVLHRSCGARKQYHAHQPGLALTFIHETGINVGIDTLTLLKAMFALNDYHGFLKRARTRFLKWSPASRLRLITPSRDSSIRSKWPTRKDGEKLDAL